MPVTREMVQQMVDADMVVIFSKSYCPYCKLAKEVFQKMKRQFTAIELDQRDDGDEIQSVLGEMTGERTVPRVFVNRKCLGGGTDVKKLYDSGKLEEMFPDA
ncbi:glutaredoxin-C4-like isoform X2 [Venturia canescens]|nr:glutaredoxin-C4-like isoform X2 [Venturia canescens]XP_043279116.1 glutaredoxin-C4-like isoform X2 [Venturia canescens]XP_043279117.1 glutaredoxin-C4-like isoform X2 [Venturia canescens]